MNFEASEGFSEALSAQSDWLRASSIWIWIFNACLEKRVKLTGISRNAGGKHATHFFTYDGNPVGQVNTKAWRKALERAEIADLRWHDLRHTFATCHREAGTPTHELQRLGGWKTQPIVERYPRVAPEGLQNAASRIDTYLCINAALHLRWKIRDFSYTIVNKIGGVDMELKEFISQALTAIVEGVVEAQKLTAKHGAFVNPGGLTRNAGTVSNDALWDNRTNNYARSVTFDVAITVEEGNSTKAGIGVVSGIFNLGAGGTSENRERALSRIQFTVPVLLPVASRMIA